MEWGNVNLNMCYYIQKNRMVILLKQMTIAIKWSMPNVLKMWEQQSELQKGGWTCPKKQKEWLDKKLGDQ